MAIRRTKLRPRRRRVKRRNVKRSRNAITRSVNTKGLAKHYFTRWCTLKTANTNTLFSAGVGGGISQGNDSWDINSGTGTGACYFSFAHFFTIDMLPDFAEYTTLFDQYKIDHVRLKITPYSATSIAQTGLASPTLANNQSMGVLMHSVIDYDDANAMNAGTVGINVMREYNTYKTKQFFNNGKPHVIKLKPRLALSAYNGAFTGYANSTGWIDSNSTGVQHYGIKWITEMFVPDVSVPIFVWFKVEAQLALECRQPI